MGGLLKKKGRMKWSFHLQNNIVYIDYTRAKKIVIMSTGNNE